MAPKNEIISPRIIDCLISKVNKTIIFQEPCGLDIKIGIPCDKGTRLSEYW
ncbi:MAG: hypothetical protein ACTSXH_09855 [Promethearchaeota archaeon]